jgi:hypothetical protein
MGLNLGPSEIVESTYWIRSSSEVFRVRLGRNESIFGLAIS